MHPSAIQTVNQANLGRIWECLNAETSTKSGSAEDEIGLDGVVGVDIWQNATVTRRSLVNADIADWIKQPRGTASQHGILSGKLLVGDQIVADDFLRPPKDAGGVTFSRNLLAQHFCLPPAAIARISQRSNWYLNFPGASSNSLRSCEGLGTSTFSLAMSIDESGGSVFAILVFHPQIRHEAKAVLLHEAELLGHLSNGPAWVPYLVMNLCSRISSDLLGKYSQKAVQIDLHLQRFATQRHIDSIFGETHARSGSVGGIHRDAQNVLKMANRWSRVVIKKSNGVSESDWAQVKAHESKLISGFEYCKQVLKWIVDEASQSRQQTTRQLTTALSMLAYEQQKMARQDQQISIDIAGASKTIAEETKKDGYSMKTLAVVTIIFLPATSVSSILAMPLFHWDKANGSDVVSDKLWVYFVLAVPLTALTVGLWWLWQGRVSKRSNKNISNC